MATDKDTAKAQKRAWYLANREAVKARSKAWRLAHPGQSATYAKTRNRVKLKAYRKAYYEARREEIKAIVRARVLQKHADVLAYQRQWWQKNRADNLAKKRAYADANRPAISAKQRESYATNPEVFKERAARRRALKIATEVEPIDFMQILRDSNGMCGICRKPLDLFGIDFDHIVPLSKGGTHTRENIQATHAYCNRSKGAKVG